MNWESFVTPENIYISTFILCFISGFLPIVNAELVVIGAAAIAGNDAVFKIGVISAFGQMLAKSLLYFAGRGVVKIPLGKYEPKLHQTQERMKNWKGGPDTLNFVSAFVGFPPFYAISILAGIIKFNFIRFFASGLLGRTLRFGLLAYSPSLLEMTF